MPFGAMRHGFTYQPAVAAGRDPLTITVLGDSITSTTQKKIGTAAFYGDGTGDVVYGDTTSVYDFTANDFTWECWFYNQGQVNRHMAGISGDSNLATMSLYHQGTTVRVYAGLSGGGWQWNYGLTGFTGTAGSPVWEHIAITKEGNTWKGFVNGGSPVTMYSTGYTMTASKYVSIGGVKNNGGWEAWPGYIDEMRVSNNIRYTTSFTPSTSAFVNDSNTVCLLHCDGSNGGTTFTDDAS